MRKPSELVGNMLGIHLPNDYKDFLNDIGLISLSKLGIEVYGYRHGIDIAKIPCVIAATNLNKELYKLSSTDIVISHTGFEDLITILDCAKGIVIEQGFNGERKEITGSFKSWLTELINKNNAATFY
jgi:hypothetical protein